ncbi:MAG TPA: CotS family spore coat protein [Candidatus Nitrosocosmicus sp.]|nr:CotS family spore coat protein [Candidatus Nitrosocosmicus sp.]
MNIDAIAKEFGCRIIYSKPLRAVSLVQTDRGMAIIKETYRDPDKILYIHGLKEYLYENGFTRVDRYMLSRYQLPFTIHENKVFVMEGYIEGRECSFTNPYDREAIVKALARLHNTGKGYIAPTGSASRSSIGKWGKSYRNKIDDLLEFKELAKGKKKKSKLDNMFLQDVDFYMEMCWRGFDTLKNSNYEEMCKKAKKENTICHHDYTYHNLIIAPDNQVNVIDFDYSCHELPVYDLASLIQKILRRYSYDVDMAFRLIEDYCSVAPLGDEDFQLMLSIFEFPQKFWRITERYYKGKTDWDEKTFLSKYNDIVIMKEFVLDFVEGFRKYI